MLTIDQRSELLGLLRTYGAAATRLYAGEVTTTPLVEAQTALFAFCDRITGTEE